MSRDKGFALAALIIILTCLGIIAAGITVYISEALRLHSQNINNSKAFYMAQAGAMKGLTDFKNSGAAQTWNKTPSTNIGGEFNYSVGEDANFFAVDATNPRDNGRILNRIPIENINAGTSISVTGLVVEWGFGGSIDQVRLGGTKVWTGPALTSPATINFAGNFVMSANTTYSGINDQVFKFTANIGANADVVCTFNFSDNSFFKTYLLKAGAGANKEFSLKATGKIQNGSTLLARRTLVLTYDYGTGNISSWEESTDHLP